ncbi:hypothetical protein PITCH_A420080 [uncultured Desulfobacterium sp.]|uniref:DUF4410 domain-containing protein n=1 Tax=uncultured Desulfobacterium sp. TaxID=201089 RepID=A0A445N0A3_9BACT|nr:hypothetical protein PITCH_A420080 [uncultured Desulfobacterium sp.]
MRHEGFIRKLVAGIILTVCIFSFFSCGGRRNAVRSDEAIGSEPQAVKTAALDKRYDTIVFQEFDVDPKMEAAYPGAVVICESAAIDALRSKNIFKKVEKENAAGGGMGGQSLLVKPRLINMRIVSGSARFWGGAFAGRSDMVVELKMTDAASGMVVHEKVLSTANNPVAAAWVMGSSDRSLPGDMGRIIADYIESIMPAG